MGGNSSNILGKALAGRLFTWNGRAFALVALSSIPIPAVALYDTTLAFAMVLGLIPAAFAGVGPTRKSRVSIVVLGVLIPVSLLAGSLLREHAVSWVAAAVLLALGLSSAFMLTRGKLIWLNMIAPVVAIGLSYSQAAVPLGFLVVMLAQSTLAFIVSLAFPRRDAPPPRDIPKMPVAKARVFGLLYGLALFSSTMISWGWDHMGWVVGSTGLVMRPTEDMQEFRSVWRAISILLGLVVVSAFLLLQPPSIVAALFGALVMAACTGMGGSRAYIMPFFMTICVFLLIEYPIGGTGEVVARFVQRLFDVGLGIAVAWIFGLAIPAVLKAIGKRLQAKAAFEERIHEAEAKTRDAFVELVDEGKKEVLPPLGPAYGKAHKEAAENAEQDDNP